MTDELTGSPPIDYYEASLVLLPDDSAGWASSPFYSMHMAQLIETQQPDAEWVEYEAGRRAAYFNWDPEQLPDTVLAELNEAFKRIDEIIIKGNTAAELGTPPRPVIVRDDSHA